MFYTILKTEIIIFTKLNLTFAIAFNLVKAKVLTYGELLNVVSRSDDEQGAPGEPQTSASVQRSLIDDLRLKFPGVFYTPTEFAEIVRLFKDFRQTTGNMTSRLVPFTPECLGSFCKIEMDEYHTCCCVS